MYKDITGAITAELAQDEADRLFDDAPVGLPDDLITYGWKLITRAPTRMFAVSTQWGCTSTKANLKDVITEARSLTRFCEHVNRARAEGRAVEID